MLSQEDNEINPHMPQYIVKAPWYLKQSENSLKHQRNQNEISKLPITSYTEKGLVKGTPVYKYRKGACENCGVLTHKTKECCERPRKVGAKWSGKDFKEDEFLHDIPLDFEGKKDIWNGYDPNSQIKQIQEWLIHEESKLKVKTEKMKEAKSVKEAKNLLKDEDVEYSASSAEEIFDSVPIDDKIEKDVRLANNAINNPISKSQKISEDYPKYLLNLNIDSAYYDGKSRAMRENPNPNMEDSLFKGDNYIRQTGDTLKLMEEEGFIKEVNEKNSSLNVIVNFY